MNENGKWRPPDPDDVLAAIYGPGLSSEPWPAPDATCGPPPPQLLPRAGCDYGESFPNYSRRLGDPEYKPTAALVPEPPIEISDPIPTSVYGSEISEWRFTPIEVFLAKKAILGVIPRSIREARTMLQIAENANIDAQLTEEVMMRLFFESSVKRHGKKTKRSDFRHFATATCERASRYLLPERLRFFKSTPPRSSK